MHVDDMERAPEQAEIVLREAAQRYRNAEFEEAYALYKKSYGLLSSAGDDARAAACLLSLADTCGALGQYREAASSYHKALMSKEKRNETNDVEYPMTLFKLAKAYEHIPEPEEADKNYFRAAEALRKQNLAGDPLLGTILEAHADFLMDHGKEEEAQALIEEARSHLGKFVDNNPMAGHYLKQLPGASKLTPPKKVAPVELEPDTYRSRGYASNYKSFVRSVFFLFQMAASAVLLGISVVLVLTLAHRLQEDYYTKKHIEPHLTEVYGLATHRGALRLGTDILLANGPFEPLRQVVVHVSRSKVPVILFLASVKPVCWKVDAEPSADVRHIYVIGYQQPTVEYYPTSIPCSVTSILGMAKQFHAPEVDSSNLPVISDAYVRAITGGLGLSQLRIEEETGNFDINDFNAPEPVDDSAAEKPAPHSAAQKHRPARKHHG